MKKVLAILLVLSVVFVMGCSHTATKDSVKQTTSVAVEIDSAAQVEINEVDSELAEIEDLDTEFDMTELDSLDEELNFEI